MKHFAVVIICLFFLQGCATTGQYQQPEGNAETLAMLKGKSSREGLATWTNFVIEAIDNRPVSFFKTGTLHQFALVPGTHRIVVYSQFNRGWGGSCPCESRLVVSARFEAGLAYRINGRVQDNRMTVWVENAKTSKRVSDIASETYTSTPEPGYVIIL